MSSRDNHNLPKGASGSLDGGLGALVRAVADGEATPEQRATLAAARERLSASDRAALDATIRAERSLREATDRCMCAACPPCPAELRERVAAAVRTDGVGRADDRGPFVLGIVRRNWMFAAAAVLALATVAGMFVIPILGPARGAWPADSGERHTLVAFLSKEHRACAPLGKYSELKLPIREPARAEAFIAQWTPDAASVMDAAGEGYSFLGVGPCGVPGAGESLQMVFVPLDPSRGPISVFLQDASSRDPEALPRTMAHLGETAAGQVVRAFAHGSCLVYVVAPSDHDAERIAESLGE